MSLYLVTGACGAGKSTVAHELIRVGLSALDGDNVPGLVEWFNVSSDQPVKYPRGIADASWLKEHKHRWNPSLIQEIARPALHKNVFLCGISSNQERLYKNFHKVFLLSTEDAVLNQRMRDRNNGNNFGKIAEEREYVLSWHARFEQRNLEAGAIPINATLPLSQVLGGILWHVYAQNPGINNESDSAA